MDMNAVETILNAATGLKRHEWNKIVHMVNRKFEEASSRIKLTREEAESIWRMFRLDETGDSGSDGDFKGSHEECPADVGQTIQCFYKKLRETCQQTGKGNCAKCWLRLYCYTAPASITPELLNEVVRTLTVDQSDFEIVD